MERQNVTSPETEIGEIDREPRSATDLGESEESIDERKRDDTIESAEEDA
jgi:hypothetical protein